MVSIDEILKKIKDLPDSEKLKRLKEIQEELAKEREKELTEIQNIIKTIQEVEIPRKDREKLEREAEEIQQETQAARPKELEEITTQEERETQSQQREEQVNIDYAIQLSYKPASELIERLEQLYNRGLENEQTRNELFTIRDALGMKRAAIYEGRYNAGEDVRQNINNAYERARNISELYKTGEG